MPVHDSSGTKNVRPVTRPSQAPPRALRPRTARARAAGPRGARPIRPYPGKASSMASPPRAASSVRQAHERRPRGASSVGSRRSSGGVGAGRRVPVAAPPGPSSRAPRCPAGTHRLLSVRRRAGRGAAAPCRSDGVGTRAVRRGPRPSIPSRCLPGGGSPPDGNAADSLQVCAGGPSATGTHPGAGRPDRWQRPARPLSGRTATQGLRRGPGRRPPVHRRPPRPGRARAAVGDRSRAAEGPARRIRRSGGSVLPDGTDRDCKNSSPPVRC
jgi:hypothetical protein